jgi:hypothetical protein
VHYFCKAAAQRKYKTWLADSFKSAAGSSSDDSSSVADSGAQQSETCSSASSAVDVQADCVAIEQPLIQNI